MPSWKKVILSGSNAQLNQITASEIKLPGGVLTGPGGGSQNTFLTVSASNATIAATSTTDTMIFEAGDGIFISASSDTDTAKLFISSSGGASTIDELSDVSSGGITRDQVLKWNGSQFVPAAYNYSFTFSITDFDCSFTSSPQLIGADVWKAAGTLTFTAVYLNGPPDATPYIDTIGEGGSMATLDMIGPAYTNATSIVDTNYPTSTNGNIKWRLYAQVGTDTDTEYSDQTIYFYNHLVYGQLANNTLANNHTHTDTLVSAGTSIITNEPCNGSTRTLNSVSIGSGNYFAVAYAVSTNADVNQVQCGTGINKITVCMDPDDATDILDKQTVTDYDNSEDKIENFYISVSRLANLDAHSSTFYLLESSTTKNYFYWGFDGQASGYNAAFFSNGTPGTSDGGDWDSYNRNALYDDSNIDGTDLTLSSFSDSYVIIAIPTRHGINGTEYTFKDPNNIDFGVNAPITLAITNPCGYAENYYVYRSVQLLSYPAGLTITVKT